MKRPSLYELAQNARSSLIRFPLVILSAFIGTVVGIYLVEVSEVTQDVFPFINLMLCAALGIPLFFSINIFLEKVKLSNKYALSIYALAVLIIVLIYLLLPGRDDTQNTFQPYIRYAIYNACLHLLVTFLPFVADRNINGFWNYNITLFIRILTSLLYSLVLFIGVVLALLAVHLLFDLDFDEKIYFQLFILIIGVFNTWVFLSGVPKRIDRLVGVSPPKELKVFAQYILLTLLSVYLLILYGYGTKIVMIWDWPRGIVSYLIICVAVLGISTFLLLYPYGQFREGKWIKRATLGFYYLLVPLLVLLFIAVSMRLEDYGFTVNRYLIFLLGIWLTIICFYFILGKGNIKFIPISLAALFFVFSFGPWGIFAVSERSQADRLKTILSQVDLLADGKIQGETIWDKDHLPGLDFVKNSENMALLTDSLYLEVSSILHYMDDFHGFKAIWAWFSQDMDQILVTVNRDKLKWQRMQEVQLYMQTMGLNYHYGPGSSSSGFYSFQADLRQTATDIKGYNYLIDFSINESESKEFAINQNIYQLRFDESGSGLMLTSDQDSLPIPLASLIERLLQEPKEQDKSFHTLPQSELLYEGEEIGGFRLLIRHINYQRTEGDKGQLKFMSGFLLLEKDPQNP